MREHDADAEDPFFDLIDCRFPYGDREAASAVIGRGFETSPNSAFGVLEEICRPPRSAQVSRARLVELLDEWRHLGGAHPHPLIRPVSQLAARVIQGVHTPVEACLSVMTTVGQYAHQRSALNITCMAADPDDDGAQARIGELEQDIRGRWERAAPS